MPRRGLRRAAVVLSLLPLGQVPSGSYRGGGQDGGRTRLQAIPYRRFEVDGKFHPSNMVDELTANDV
jgi:hypothetical protein